MNGPLLLCYDGSEDSARGIDAAAALFEGRPAFVLTVAPSLTYAEAMALTASPLPGRAFEDLNQAAARERAELGVERARKAGLVAQPYARLGEPIWQAIIDTADELDAAVIVIGSRGLAGLRELARGSVSHDVATRTRRPVLIVPPDEKENS